MIEQTFRDTLSKRRLKLTPERLYIFRILKDLKKPCSMAELVDLSRGTVDRSTVYRTIELFEKTQITVRVNTGWKYKIELSDKFSPHHHHMSCTNCSNVVSFEESQAFLDELHSLEKRYGFTTGTHSLELTGLCKDCC